MAVNDPWVEVMERGVVLGNVKFLSAKDVDAALTAERALHETELRRIREENAKLKADIDGAWRYIEMGYDIESRAEIEASSEVGTVFASPLQMALHLIGKRRRKES